MNIDEVLREIWFKNGP